MFPLFSFIFLALSEQPHPQSQSAPLPALPLTQLTLSHRLISLYFSAASRSLSLGSSTGGGTRRRSPPHTWTDAMEAEGYTLQAARQAAAGAFDPCHSERSGVGRQHSQQLQRLKISARCIARGLFRRPRRAAWRASRASPQRMRRSHSNQ